MLDGDEGHVSKEVGQYHSYHGFHRFIIHGIRQHGRSERAYDIPPFQ